MDSPRQGEPVNHDEPKIKHTGHGSRSGTRARPQPEGSHSEG